MKKTALDACVLLLRPIASVLLRFGITWKEFSEISKRVFVEVATKEYGIKGRPTNASRVEILTGVNRREVMRLRKEKLTTDIIELHRYGLISAIQSGWFEDPDFSDGKGTPLLLEKEGTFPSFSDLYKRYGRDVSIQAVLKELINNKSILEHKDGKLELIERYFTVFDSVDKQLQNFCVLLSDYAETSRHNYLVSDKTQLRLSGYAQERIPVTLYPEFRRLAYAKGEKLLEEIDAWLTKNKAVNDDSETLRLGVGTYMIYDKDKYK